jgi:glycerol uptake facilitator-like aquaporin
VDCFIDAGDKRAYNIKHMNIKKYILEVIGTFALVLAVVLGLVKGLGLAVPLLAAIVIGIFVYSIGSMCSGFFNPAMTLGALSINKISVKDAIFYIIAQFVGAALAIIVLSLYKIDVPMPPAEVLVGWPIFFAEIVGAFFFAFGVASVVYQRAAASMTGIVVGGSLLIGLVVASALGSIGILNPAIAFALHSANWVYIIAPIVGAVGGMWAYKALLN